MFFFPRTRAEIADIHARKQRAAEEEYERAYIGNVLKSYGIETADELLGVLKSTVVSPFVYDEANPCRLLGSMKNIPRAKLGYDRVSFYVKHRHHWRPLHSDPVSVDFKVVSCGDGFSLLTAAPLKHLLHLDEFQPVTV